MVKFVCYVSEGALYLDQATWPCPAWKLDTATGRRVPLVQGDPWYGDPTHQKLGLIN
jgi:hypothetical protein